MKAFVTFNAVIVKDLYFDNSSKKSHLISEVVFDLEIPDRGDSLNGLTAEVTQPWATSFGDPAEVGPPAGYDGPWNHLDFADHAEEYLRLCVGPTGKLMRVDKSADHIAMTNCTLAMSVPKFSMELPE